MFKRGYRLFWILLLVSVIFSVSSFDVNAQKQTTCLNPLGKNFCDNYNPTDQCYCDSKCEEYKDCCSDYQSVCKGGSTGGGGGGTSVCGNGIIETGEECDGANLNAKSCESFGYSGGFLQCSACKFDTSNCIKQDGLKTCGNGIREAGEMCDGNDLGGYSCTTFGYSGGTLKCSNCQGFDYSGCVKQTDVLITENVECIFLNSKGEQKCYSAKGGQYCSGIESCKTTVTGSKGEKIAWTSTCSDPSGDKYVIIDGENNVVIFNCGDNQSNNTIPDSKCVDTDGGVNEFVAGKTYIDGTKDIHYDTCLYDQSNSLIEYSCFNNVIQKSQIQCKNGCKDGACLKQVSTCSPQAPIWCPNLECQPGATSVQDPLTCCYKCVKQNLSSIQAYANKPYTINNPFFLSASGFSENSIITSVNWNQKDNPCKFTTKQDKGLKVSSNVYSEIEVTCNTPGVKSFIVTFTDDKGIQATDIVHVYVNEGKKTYEQQSTIPTSTYQQPTTPTQQTKSTSNSCANRCGFYDPKESCQCDDVCKDYGDCCLDKAQLCG